MARLRVVDGGRRNTASISGILREAENILNKLLRTADKGWLSSCDLGEALQLTVKNNLLRVVTYLAGSCEHGNEPSRSTKGWEFLH
jgi:hypothetical protein